MLKGQSTPVSDGSDVDRDETLMKMHKQMQSREQQIEPATGSYDASNWTSAANPSQYPFRNKKGAFYYRNDATSRLP